MICRRRIPRVACMLLLILAPPCFAASAYLQPAAIFEGDISEMVIEHDSKVASLFALDTGELARDFEILDIKSRVFRIDEELPGRHRMQWRLQLLPRRSGSLLVPPIRFGEHSTPPLSLEVKPVPDEVRSSQQVFVDVDSEPRAPYVGQQTLLTVRLFHNTPLRIDGLSEPRPSGAASYRDIDERVYFVERGGSQFRVLERRMLFFPRQAGELELPPAVLRGQLRGEDTARAGDKPASRKISRSSDPLGLRVREPPSAFTGRYWLPARDLVIAQRLQPLDGELRIGDSIDWQLSLEAKGLPGASLPANLLEFEAPNYTVYADKPVRSDRLEDGELVGSLDQRFAIIVTGAGAIELPRIDLRWWDTAADRERQARLESRRLGFAQDAVRHSEPRTTNDLQRMLLPLAGDDRGWVWPLASLATLGLLLVAARALWRHVERPIESLLRRWRIRSLLKQACQDGKAPRARALLIEWGRARWPGEAINGLYQIGERCGSARLDAELARLDAALYSPAPIRWQGSGLWAALSPRRRASEHRQRMPGLYPD